MGKKKFVISDHEVSERFTLVEANLDQTYDMKDVVANIKAVALVLNGLLPDGRDKALALTRLEEAEMWAISAILRGTYDD